jgi:hypothetical protein
LVRKGPATRVLGRMAIFDRVHLLLEGQSRYFRIRRI